MTTIAPSDFAKIDQLDKLNTSLDPLSFRAGWNKQEPSLWPQPRTGHKEAKWSWDHAKAGLDAAGRLISAEQAERRNLFMVNPMEGNYYSTLRTLVCAYQMILPGETARSHRHTPNALRLVLDVAEGAYTVVDGIRIDMKPNDVLLTPGWSWHGHANEGDRPGYWIDFLDVPLVQLLEPMFLEAWPEGFQKPERIAREPSVVFSWDETSRKLDGATADEYGRIMVELGRPALSTIALAMQKLEVGSKTPPIRTTENQIFAVVSGSGRTNLDSGEISWSRGDVFCVPSWHGFSHTADQNAVLFRVSDSPVMSKLGFLRMESA